MNRQTIFGLGIAALAAFVLYWLNKNGLLHESVSAIVTPQGTVVSDANGIPQFDLRDSRTFSQSGYAASVWPLCGLLEGATPTPSDPSKCTCPSGFTLFHEVSLNNYLCLKDGV